LLHDKIYQSEQVDGLLMPVLLVRRTVLALWHIAIPNTSLSTWYPFLAVSQSFDALLSAHPFLELSELLAYLLPVVILHRLL